ncbi:MAG: response regulator [Lachnospiraceae bacterium]|nr:response regulator [Lachnospiraceae bacterium]
MDQKTILIVDDEELTLMLTEGILSKEYNTLRALSGEEGIRLYGEHHPDMVLSDLMMPGMSGFEMLEKMREQYGRAIPIIFMTAHEGEETELKSLTSGAVDFIRKPLKADVLLKSINSIMERLEMARRM